MNWFNDCRSRLRGRAKATPAARPEVPWHTRIYLRGDVLTCLLICALAFPPPAHGKDKRSYGEGLIVNIPMPEPQVAQVVADVAQNGVVRGTKEYIKDEYISGAKAASSSRVFPAWNEGGKVFYKVREQALDPWNFKAGGDLGTLVVRYVVQPQGEKNTVLRIDAVFAPQYRSTIHPSDGTVETAEYKDIRDHLDAILQMERQDAEAANEREQLLEKKQEIAMSGGAARADAASSSSRAMNSRIEDSQTTDSRATERPPQQSAPVVAQPVVNMPPVSAPAPPRQSLEEHVKDLRQQVERLVKPPGAPLKSAPFHTAKTLDSLTAGTEVLIVISTPYWYGVETRKGQRGWILRDQLEQP